MAVALLPTLLAIGLGAALGLRWGGRLDNLAAWRPPMWPALAGGVAVLVLLDLVPLGGWFASLLRLGALGAVGAFAVLNVRVGGMLLVVVGVGLEFLVTLINWGTPVSGAALVSAGIVTEGELARVELSGGRVLADGALLGFLGDTIALPWGQIVSITDLIVLAGVVLVTASVARRYQVGGTSSGFASRGRGGGLGGPGDYRSALDALGRGPAPRKGPGLHPSRLPGERSGPRRRTAGRGGRPGRATR